ncbi:MAG: molybdenum cofactor biosynthesis protein MoaE [Gammaproteobacteria bacterium]
MRAQVIGHPLDPWTEVAAYQAAHPALSGKYGGSAVFVGAMRDFNQGATVRAMTLEHYPAMTEKYLVRIAQTAIERWSLVDALVLHRYGDMQPGDPIVLVAVWAARRAEAFAACRYIIDELKTRAPFWKRERTPAGERWVEPEVE